MASDFSRTYIELVNNQKVNVIYDFAYGEYIATEAFFAELSQVQTDLLTTGKVILSTGQTADAESPGGLMAINIYMEALDSQRQSMSGLAKLGLNVEKQLWKNI
mgnify:FL=1|jgi:hypothetical protein